MAKINIKVESNVEQALKQLNLNVEQALYLIGTECVNASVESISNENFAVDTGRLRASISFVTKTQSGNPGQSGGSAKNPLTASDFASSGSTPKNNEVIIGTNVEYATYVHEGTAKRPGRPFLRDGIMKAMNGGIEERVKKILENK